MGVSEHDAGAVEGPMRFAAIPLSKAICLAGLFLISRLLFDCPTASGDPVLGFIEHWNAGTTAGWGGGDNYSNPGTGGALGAGDGYLAISTPGPPPFNSLNLGTATSNVAYTGNWAAAGITRVQF